MHCTGRARGRADPPAAATVGGCAAIRHCRPPPHGRHVAGGGARAPRWQGVTGRCGEAPTVSARGGASKSSLGLAHVGAISSGPKRPSTARASVRGSFFVHGFPAGQSFGFSTMRSRPAMGPFCVWGLIHVSKDFTNTSSREVKSVSDFGG